MGDSSLCTALLLVCVLIGLRARIDVYGAFAAGAKEGLLTLIGMAPYLCAVFAMTALLREAGVLSQMQSALAPAMEAIGLESEAAGVVLLRPLSGSAALAAVRDVMNTYGVDSRAARIACVISASSETMLFTGSLYLGAAGARSGGYAFCAALAAYAAGLIAAGLLVA